MLVSLALLPSLLLGCGSQSATDDAARLVPADSTVLVRFQSLDALLDLVHAFGPIRGEPVQSLDAEMLFAGMNFPGDVAAVDRARPLYFAVKIDPNAPMPAMSWAVPVKDAAAFQRPIAALGGMMKCATAGTYVGVSMLKTYAACTTPSALVTGLRPGVVAVHVDLGKLVQLYRPMIDMGLAQAEAGLEARETGPIDVRPMLEMYLGAARNALDCAEALDLAVARKGDELALQIDFQARAGSKLDGWQVGGPAELAKLARFLDPACSGQAVLAADWSRFFGTFSEVFETVSNLYPPPLRIELQRLMRDQARFAGLLQPGLASSFDFDQAGFRATYVLRSSRPEEVVARFQELAKSYDREGSLIRLHDARDLDLAGLQAHTWQMTIDHELLQEAFRQAAPEGDEVPELGPIMESIYGKDLLLGMAQHDGIVLVVLAADEKSVSAGLERLRRSQAPDARMLRLIERTGGGTPSFAYRVDVGRALSQLFVANDFGKMISAMGGQMPADLPESSFAFDVWGSIRGRTWSGGFGASLAEFLDFARALQATGK